MYKKQQWLFCAKKPLLYLKETLVVVAAAAAAEREKRRKKAMAASRKDAAAVCVVLVAVAMAMRAEAQECVPQLNRLLACRPYAVPGAGDPSPECCSALGSISQGCACSAMGIINSLPSRCHIAQVNCSA